MSLTKSLRLALAISGPDYSHLKEPQRNVMSQNQEFGLIQHSQRGLFRLSGV